MHQGELACSASSGVSCAPTSAPRTWSAAWAAKSSESCFEVDGLADGIGAVNLQNDYDVILLDLNMPVFDGERLVDYWSLTDPARLQRTIVFSGYSRFANGRQLETFATVRKPFDTKELMEIVERCLKAEVRGSTFE